MLCVVEVKCYSCGRVCGEIRVPSQERPSMRLVRPVAVGRPCGLNTERLVRCTHCGGNIYLDETACVYGYEVYPPASEQQPPLERRLFNDRRRTRRAA